MEQITDYTTLQDAVVGMMHKTGDTDFADSVPLFIQTIEADLNDRLLLKDSESDETLTLTADANYVALPTGFISPIKFWLIVDTQRIELVQVLPEQLPYYPDSGQPQFWAIDGANVRFDRPSDDAYSARLRCMKASNLSESNTTNYLLLRRPDVYLYGTLMQACLFSEDDNNAKKWGGFYENAIAALKSAENRARGNASLRTDLPMRARSNILTGQ